MDGVPLFNYCPELPALPSTSWLWSNVFALFVRGLVVWTRELMCDFGQHRDWKRLQKTAPSIAAVFCRFLQHSSSWFPYHTADEIIFSINQLKRRFRRIKAGKEMNLILTLWWLIPFREATCGDEFFFSWRGHSQVLQDLDQKSLTGFSNRLVDLLIRKHFLKDCLTAVMNMTAFWVVKS